MLLYLVRHGETDCNNLKIIQGQSVPSHLTEAGRHQAHIAGRRLAGYGFTHVYVSDLIRARETADIICSYTGNTPVEDTLLRERCFGVLEGRTREDINKNFPVEGCPWRAAFAAAPPEGESLADVVHRASLFIEKLTANHSDNDKVMAVTHGGTLRGMVLSLMGLEPEVWRMLNFSNTSVSLFELKDGKVYLKYLNDAAHLEFESLLAGEDVDNAQ